MTRKLVDENGAKKKYQIEVSSKDMTPKKSTFATFFDKIKKVKVNKTYLIIGIGLFIVIEVTILLIIYRRNKKLNKQFNDFDKF